jgi:hypothetical protein
LLDRRLGPQYIHDFITRATAVWSAARASNIGLNKKQSRYLLFSDFWNMSSRTSYFCFFVFGNTCMALRTAATYRCPIYFHLFNSSALKIQISKATRDALAHGGGYVMPYRGRLQVKVNLTTLHFICNPSRANLFRLPDIRPPPPNRPTPLPLHPTHRNTYCTIMRNSL